MTQSGCRGEAERGKEGKSAASASGASLAEQPQPAGPEVIAALGGLQVGSEIAGWKVSWVGSVDDQGQIRILAERGGEQMRLSVALDGDGPRPPARVGPYALYYEATERVHGASEEECKRVIEALAKRMSEVDAAAPPTGLRPLPRRSMPL